jgi:hypothetical protein
MDYNPYAPTKGTLNGAASSVAETGDVDAPPASRSEALFGRTLGKLVTRTRVVSESGAPATFWQLLMRTLYRLMPFEGFSFLATRRPGWHDRWSKTRVVLTRRAGD